MLKTRSIKEKKINGKYTRKKKKKVKLYEKYTKINGIVTIKYLLIIHGKTS